NRSITLKERSKKMVGQTIWLPEPVATEGAEQWINRREVLSITLMVLLEHLNPKERAVFILKEAFDYSHEQIADVFGFSPVNSRQLLRRAKHLLKEKHPELRVARSPQDDTLFQYVEAIKRGQMGLLETMLSENITSQSDGGGKIKVLSEFSTGIIPVAQLTVRVYALYLRKCRIEFKSINSQPALVFYKEHRLVCCQVLAISSATGKIHHIYNVVDPGKLKSLSRSSGTLGP